MIISNSNRFIFFHVPKSGGTSVTLLLDEEVRWNDLVLGGTDLGEAIYPCYSERFLLRKHSLPEEVAEVIGDETYSTYRKFVVIRHPVTRAQSVYKFLKTQFKNQSAWFMNSDDASRVDGLETFESFVEGTYFRHALATEPRAATDMQRWILPQSNWVDRRAYLAKRFDVFKLEELIADCTPLTARGYVRSRCTLPHHNASESFDAPLSPSVTRVLESAYASDFKFFGYSPRVIDSLASLATPS